MTVDSEPSHEHTFRCIFQTDSTIQHRAIHGEFFANAVKGGAPQQKVEAVVQLLIPQLTALAEMDPQPDVVVLLLPPSVERDCAALGAAFAGRKLLESPRERWEKKMRRVISRTGQSFFDFDFDVGDAEDEPTTRGFLNIHHEINAHAMATDPPRFFGKALG